MNNFHQIPTDKFVPISHDNSYLFLQYEKIANFLAFNLEKNYKNILAKPIQNGFVIDWFSNYENLININEKKKSETEKELLIYWSFIDKISVKIKQLSNSSDENNKNWANLLTKVFNHQENYIFSNGVDICIVWGWKFENNEIYKPDTIVNEIEDNSISEEKEELNSFDEENLEESITVIDQTEGFGKDIEEANLNQDENIVEIENPFDTKVIQNDLEFGEIRDEENVDKDSNFKKFLKWFASRFWWLLWLLLIIILFFLLLKSCNCNDNEINNKLILLEEKANNCCN